MNRDTADATSSPSETTSAISETDGSSSSSGGAEVQVETDQDVLSLPSAGALARLD